MASSGFGKPSSPGAGHALHVVAVGGDGDGYGIGVGHFIHAMRRNLNLTYIVMDNEVYGLTTGQTSPTTLEGHKTRSTPRRLRSDRPHGRAGWQTLTEDDLIMCVRAKHPHEVKDPKGTCCLVPFPRMRFVTIEQP